MKYRYIVTLLAASLIVTGVQAQKKSDLFVQARTYYENGAYGRARSMFESLGDPLSKGYAVLCAIKVNSSDYPALMAAYEAANPQSVLNSTMHYESARNLFDQGEYTAAASQLAQVDTDGLSQQELTEYYFKKGYCAYSNGDFPTARSSFAEVEKLPHSIYTAPGRYAMGYMAYAEKDWDEASKYFAQSAKDARFKELSNYYLMECRFMEKDYDFVIDNGPSMIDNVPAERKSRLARIISESYLVKGNKQKALEYYQKEEIPAEKMNRSDYFHAGSVQYAVGDYQGAIDNFSKMPERTDSIGQVANYDLGYSYIQTKNKVAAVDAFKDASAQTYDPDIQQDAYFNYAKLSFDLNNDTAPFKQYLKNYPQTGKNDQIYSYMAIAALNDKDYVAAIDAYSNIETLDEDQKLNYSKANYLRANQLISSGSYNDAVPYLKAAGFYMPKTDRLNQLSRYWLGESYFATGDYDSAQNTFSNLYNTSALRGMEESAQLPYNLGYAYLEDKEYANAAKWFDSYLSSGDDANRTDAMVRRADCDLARKQYKSAISGYQKAIDQDPSNIYPRYQQAIAYGLAGDKKSKVKALSKVESVSADTPMYSEAMYELGRSYMELGDNNNALTTFNTLKNNTKDNVYVAKSLIGEGMSYRNMGKYDSALKSYKQVVNLMPDSEYSEEALLAINSIYQTTKQPEKYLDYLEENNLTAGKSESEKEAVYFNTAEQVFLAGNYNQAVSTLNRYLENYPDGTRRGDAYFYMAESYKALGNKEKALDCYALANNYLSGGSFAESSALNYANLAYSLERFEDAYEGYSNLLNVAEMAENKSAARVGMMRSAYSARQYEDAVDAANKVKAATKDAATTREANLTAAKSYLALSKRSDALKLFETLAKSPSTAEGAEASYMLIQNLFDSGKFSEVENKVYDFAGKCGDQTYWLAKSYITLGDSFLERGNKAQAKATWESIRDGYSGNDDIAETVKSRLAKL